MFKKASVYQIPLNYYYNRLLYKKVKSCSRGDKVVIRWPVFSRRVSAFELQGTMLRRKMKMPHLNQTVRLSAVVSQNRVYFAVPTQCPVIVVK